MEKTRISAFIRSDDPELEKLIRESTSKILNIIFDILRKEKKLLNKEFYPETFISNVIGNFSGNILRLSLQSCTLPDNKHPSKEGLLGMIASMNEVIDRSKNTIVRETIEEIMKDKNLEQEDD